jgi:hypothetical protein
VDRRLIEKAISLVKAIGLEHSFDHLEAMTMPSQFAGHLQHGFGSVVSAHPSRDGDRKGPRRAERRRLPASDGLESGLEQMPRRERPGETP